MIGMGIGFVFIPNLVLGVLGVPAVTDVWIRVLGLLSGAAGFYYVQAAHHNLVPFFWASVWGRMTFAIGIVAFALLGIGPTVLILFGVLEFASAVWTWVALRANTL